MRKKLILGFVLLLISIFMLSGCITYTLKTTINPNGSGSRIIDAAIDKTYVEQFGSNLEEGLKKGAPKEAKFKTYTKDNQQHYEIIFEFKNIDDLKDISKKMSGNEQGPNISDVKLKITDFFVIATYEFSENIPGSGEEVKKDALDLGQLSSAFSLNYELTLPGKITKANTEKIEGSTASWEIDSTKGKKIEATSTYVRWWAIIIVAIVLVGIIVVISIFILTSRRKKATSASNKT